MRKIRKGHKQIIKGPICESFVEIGQVVKAIGRLHTHRHTDRHTHRQTDTQRFI